MGAAMFYPRTSVLPTIKTSLPSSINCLTNHPLDDGHQSRFHEHNHCWLHRLPVKQKFIYLTKSRQFCSGAAVPEVAWEQYILTPNLFPFSPKTLHSLQQHDSSPVALPREESGCWKVLKSFALSQMSEPVRSGAPMPVRQGGSPLITIITSPIYCGRQTNVRP